LPRRRARWRPTARVHVVVALAERHRDRDVEIGEPAAGDLLGLLVELCEQRRGQGPDGGKRIGLVAVTTELRHDRVGFDPCRVEVCRLELPSRVAQRGSQPMVAACTRARPIPQRSDVCGGVRFVESLGDHDLGEAGPDRGDGCADTRVVECGAAPGMTSLGAT
jgi:hypothetical protein